MSKTGSRFAVFLFNVVIALLSAAAIAATFVGPLWKIKADYLLRPAKKSQGKSKKFF